VTLGVYGLAKRIFDFLFAVFLLILMGPIMLVIALLIRVDSPGPAMFKQVRVGRNNQPFTIYKFRSMRTDTPDVATDQLQNPRQFITRMGTFIRKTSIDELPQLFNILRGEMSFVGPRPALHNQYELIKQRTVYGVDKLVPGLTGHAQINGRDDISDDEKIKLDYEYLKIAGFWLDIKIIIKTIYLAAVFKGVKG
jgi:O-antigen biosynthesis protein WbqP